MTHTSPEKATDYFDVLFKVNYKLFENERCTTKQRNKNKKDKAEARREKKVSACVITNKI